MERISTTDTFESADSTQHFVGAKRHLSSKGMMERISTAGTFRSADSSQHFVGAQRHLSSIKSINYAETRRAGPRPGKLKSRWLSVWRHYKRWWFCYMMAFVVAGAVGFPVL